MTFCSDFLGHSTLPLDQTLLTVWGYCVICSVAPGTMLDLANKKCFEWAGSRAFCSQSSMCRGLLILDAPLPWLLAWLGQLHNTGGGRDQGNFHPFPLLQASSLIAGLSRSSFTKQTGHVLAACRQPQFLGSRNPTPSVPSAHVEKFLSLFYYLPWASPIFYFLCN